MTRHPGTFVSGLLFALFGAAYLLDVAGVWDFRPGRSWPVVLIAVGLTIVLGAAARGRSG
jgi:hypothetical protein